jgi:hypothetical protein
MRSSVDKAQVSEGLRRIVAELAVIRGSSEADLLSDRAGIPRFLEAAAERARAQGKTVEQILEQDARAIREARYPGPDCLEPNEVAAWSETKSLPPHRLAHVAECKGCERLLELATPSSAKIRQVVEAARAEVAMARAEVAMVVAENPSGTRLRSRLSHGIKRHPVMIFVAGLAMAAIIVLGALGPFPETRLQRHYYSSAAFAPSPSAVSDSALQALSRELTKEMDTQLRGRITPESLASLLRGNRGIVVGQLERSGNDLQLNVAFVRFQNDQQIPIKWMSTTVPEWRIRQATDSLTRRVLQASDKVARPNSFLRQQPD